jgi:hypothetical protein
MFPNVRLLLAAMFASVIALSCGFAVLAAFRVDHEPLAGIRPAAAPLQLLADNTSPTNVTIAWGEPFGSRFRVEEGPRRAAPPDGPAFRPIRRDGDEQVNSAVLWHAAAATAGAPARFTPNVTQAPEAGDRISEPAPAGTPQIAIVEPEPSPAPPSEEPADVTGTTPEAVPETEVKAPARATFKPARPMRRTARATIKRSRAALRRTRGAIAVRFAGRTSYFDRPNFQSAPHPLPPARSPRTARRTARTNAIGGPLVRLPRQ